jgi:hypothetical protein
MKWVDKNKNHLQNYNTFIILILIQMVQYKKPKMKIFKNLKTVQQCHSHQTSTSCCIWFVDEVVCPFLFCNFKLAGLIQVCDAIQFSFDFAI